jgi:uncharacterized membrane protein
MTSLTFDAATQKSPTTRLPHVSGSRKGRGRHADDPRPPARRRVALAALLLAQAPMLLDLDIPGVRPALAFLTLLALPTWVLYRRAGLPGDTEVVRFLHAFGASLLALVVVGLVINTVLPVFGIDRPLAPVVIGLTWLGLDAVLLMWRREVPLVEHVSARRAAERVWAARADLAEAAAVVAVVLAILGAIRLNNGAGGGLALVAHLIAAATVAALFLRQGTLGRDVRVLFLLSTALLLATSLRGWGITGHDIQAEYYAFSLTDGAQHWTMDVLQNAYNACLSVTILPTVLVQATALSGVTIFKVVLQLVFALVPVIVYLVSRRFVPRRLALTGVVFLVGFPAFSTDMPYLVRQEVAFLFVALLLLAATEPGGNPWFKRALVAVFGVGVVLAHYSTTYLLLLGLVAGLAFLGAAWLLAMVTRRGADRRPLVLLSPVVVAFLAAVSVLWAGPVTDTGSHAEDVARSTIAAILGQAEDSPGSSDLSFSILGGDDASARARMNMYVDETMGLRKDAPRDILLIKEPGRTAVRPTLVEADRAPLTPAGELLDGIGVDPGDVAVVARIACAVLLQVFLLLGVWRVVLARRRNAAHERVSPEVGALVLGLMAALGLVVVVPGLSVEYGVLRAFLQTMLLLAPVAALGMWWLLERVGRATTAWMVGVPVAILLVLTAAAPSLLGGNPAKLALHNKGLYHDRYVAADSDKVAAERLVDVPDRSDGLPKVITSRNQVLRVLTAGLPAEEVVDRIFPTLLHTHSYVFVEARLTKQREATIFYSGDRITYKYPLGQLDRRLNLVYSSGASRIYR